MNPMKLMNNFDITEILAALYWSGVINHSNRDNLNEIKLKLKKYNITFNIKPIKVVLPSLSLTL